MAVTLALDIGGTKIATGLVDGDGALAHHAKLPTPDGDAEDVWAVVDTLPQASICLLHASCWPGA